MGTGVSVSRPRPDIAAQRVVVGGLLHGHHLSLRPAKSRSAREIPWLAPWQSTSSSGCEITSPAAWSRSASTLPHSRVSLGHSVEQQVGAAVAQHAVERLAEAARRIEGWIGDEGVHRHRALRGAEAGLRPFEGQQPFGRAREARLEGRRLRRLGASRYERPAAHRRLDRPAGSQLLVGLGDGVPVDPELSREIPDGRQAFAHRQAVGLDGPADLVGDLSVHGPSGPLLHPFE